MKKIIFLLILWVSVPFGFTLAGKPIKSKILKPFCINCETGQITIHMDVYMVVTDFIEGTKIAEQFINITGKPLTQLILTEQEIDEFLDFNGKDFIRWDGGSYFLTTSENEIKILSVKRDENSKFHKELLDWDALIPAGLSGQSMNIFVPKPKPKPKPVITSL